MSRIMRNPSLVIGLVCIVASLYLLEYFVKGTPLTYYIGQFSNWSLILASWAMALGFANMTYRHGTRLIRTKGRSLSSLWLLFVMFITAGIGISMGTKAPWYLWIYGNVYTPIEASLLSFSFIYTSSAAIRMFRLRSVNESLLLIAAVLAMLGNIALISSFNTTFVGIKDWLTSVPSAGAFAAFNIGVAIGTILMALRTMAGMERGWLGRVEEA